MNQTAKVYGVMFCLKDEDRLLTVVQARSQMEADSLADHASRELAAAGAEIQTTVVWCHSAAGCEFAGDCGECVVERCEILELEKRRKGHGHSDWIATDDDEVLTRLRSQGAGPMWHLKSRWALWRFPKLEFFAVFLTGCNGDRRDERASVRWRRQGVITKLRTLGFTRKEARRVTRDAIETGSPCVAWGGSEERMNALKRELEEAGGTAVVQKTGEWKTNS